VVVLEPLSLFLRRHRCSWGDGVVFEAVVLSSRRAYRPDVGGLGFEAARRQSCFEAGTIVIETAVTSSRRWQRPQEGHAALMLGAPVLRHRRCFKVGVLVLEVAVLSSKRVRRLEARFVVSRSEPSCLTQRHHLQGR
jgi:hypothetical protein